MDRLLLLAELTGVGAVTNAGTLRMPLGVVVGFVELAPLPSYTLVWAEPLSRGVDRPVALLVLLDLRDCLASYFAMFSSVCSMLRCIMLLLLTISLYSSCLFEKPFSEL